MANTLTLKKEPTQVGDNVLAAMTEDGKLVLVIDPTKRLRRSKSGDNIIIASTGGNISVGEAKLGLNMYTKPEIEL